MIEYLQSLSSNTVCALGLCLSQRPTMLIKVLQVISDMVVDFGIGEGALGEYNIIKWNTNVSLVLTNAKFIQQAVSIL